MALAFHLYDDIRQVRSCARILGQLYAAYVAADATLAEINPLITTPDGELHAIDAKMNIDDNGLFRLPHVEAMRDESAEAPSETRAREAGLTYIKLDGNVGCVVNGAGLAMATMDIIKLYGGSPANFLDVGGGANAEQVTAAFKIMLKSDQVKAIMVNIFGGIMRCDVIAQGIVQAAKEVQLKIPLIVRLEGTNVEQGRQILAESGIQLITATTMSDAAEKAVKAVA
jgi:succinyl-CoA synthetase beta subunit